jgi:hypothetical protein
VTGHAAVGIDDDLASGQTAVTHRATDDELAGGVDVVLGAGMQQLGRDHVLDDGLHHRLAQVFLGDLRIVLGGQHNGIDTDHLAVLVAAGDLGLGVRAQPVQGTVLAHLGLALDQTVGEGDGRGHQHAGLVAGIAEHQTLVAGALILGLLPVHTLGDIRGLLADDVDHATGIGVVADLGGGVADILDHLAHQILQVDPGAGGDFPADDRHAGLDHGFAGHTGQLVLGENGVEHGVGDLISQFVRMAFGYRFGREDAVFTHGSGPWKIVEAESEIRCAVPDRG